MTLTIAQTPAQTLARFCGQSDPFDPHLPTAARQEMHDPVGSISSVSSTSSESDVQSGASTDPIAAAVKFVDLLDEIEDPRDNRGKRHNLSFTITAVILAILSDRSTMSGIHRFIKNKIEWLKDILDRPLAYPVSRAQLPRIIAAVEFEELNKHVEKFFGANIELVDGEWTAVDGKTLRGTITDKKTRAHENEKIVIAVGHQSQQTTYQRPIVYGESSEIEAVRQLLLDTDLSAQKVTLDALHIQFETLEIIHLHGGHFIVQVKNNQLTLCNILKDIAQIKTPNVIIQTSENNRGRQETRTGSFFSLEQVQFDEKWQNCGFKTLIVVDRKRKESPTDEESEGRYYYLSNQESAEYERELFTAIRKHWQVEVNNHIRDVTLKEDHVKTKDKNQGQILSLLRTLALNVVKEVSPGNVKKAMHKFADCPDFFVQCLKRVNFL